MKLKLDKDEYVVTAYAKSASGPGWSNMPVWVIIKSSFDGKLREECIQPFDQTDDMRILYNVSQAAHEAMTGAVSRSIKKK